MEPIGSIFYVLFYSSLFLIALFGAICAKIVAKNTILFKNVHIFARKYPKGIINLMV